MARFDEIFFDEKNGKFIDLRTGADVSELVLPVGAPEILSYSEGVDLYGEILAHAPHGVTGFVKGEKREILGKLNILPIQYFRHTGNLAREASDRMRSEDNPASPTIYESQGLLSRTDHPHESSISGWDELRRG